MCKTKEDIYESYQLDVFKTPQEIQSGFVDDHQYGLCFMKLFQAFGVSERTFLCGSSYLKRLLGNSAEDVASGRTIRCQFQSNGTNG